jgi:hypothetical protein
MAMNARVVVAPWEACVVWLLLLCLFDGICMLQDRLRINDLSGAVLRQA